MPTKNFSQIAAKLIFYAFILLSSLGGTVPQEGVRASEIESIIRTNPMTASLLLRHKVIGFDELEAVPMELLAEGVEFKSLALATQERLAAPYLQRAQRHFIETGKKTVVLGHLSETHAEVWQDKDYLAVLVAQDWTVEKNMAWLHEHVFKAEASEVLLVSRPRQHTKSYPHEPVFHLELRSLIRAGYIRAGNYLVKAPLQAGYRPAEVQKLDGVCFVPSCYQ